MIGKSNRAAVRGALILAAIIATAGVGFAAYSASTTVSASGSSATFYLTIADTAQCASSGCTGSTPYLYLTSAPSYISLSSPSGFGTAIASISIGLFLPGDSATINFWVYDGGSLAANIIHASITSTTGYCDSIWTVTDNIPGVVGAGAASPASLTMSLASLSTITAKSCLPTYQNPVSLTLNILGTPV